MKISRPFSGLALLGCLFIFFLLVISAVSAFVVNKFGTTAATVRILTVMQDLFVFILPAVVTAMLSTRLPATMLRIDKLPTMKSVLFTLLLLLVAIPAMNMVVSMNEAVQFPGELEAQLRALESQAADTVNMLSDGTSAGSLVLMILIVGVLAGLSEELFFRGALQRLLGATSVGTHAAIWFTALIFTTIHFQFYGFVPRMLLGAYFGYLAVWSGSLWLPIIAHAFNNSLAVLSVWLTARGSSIGDAADKFGGDFNSPGQIIAALLSVAATVVGILILKKILSKKAA